MTTTEKCVIISDFRFLKKIKLRKMYLDSVSPVELAEYIEKDDAQKIISENIKNCKFKEPGIFAFKNVPMHIDSISGTKGWLCAVFMIRGEGDLQHFLNKTDYKNKKITNTKIYAGYYLIFNDALPHSFSADKNCYAMISSIKGDLENPPLNPKSAHCILS